jgi:uncharacterized glyoxalase superfamily protein PhnB
MASLLSITSIAAVAQQNRTENSLPMKKIDQIYTVFITNKLNETVTFYESYFGFTKLFESTFFVLLQSPGSQNCVAFMDEQHPTAPPTPTRFNGSGSFLTLEVPDAEALFLQIRKQGLKIDYELKDEAWGQRRFGVVDPNGLWVDVVQQIEPQEDFWTAYMKN